MTGVSRCLSTESRPVWWFRLWQRRAGPVWQRRTEPSPQRRGLGPAPAAVSGLHTAAPLWASVREPDAGYDLLQPPASEQPSQTHTCPSARHVPVAMEFQLPRPDCDELSGRPSTSFGGDAETPAVPRHGWLWQLVQLDENVVFKFNRVHFVGNVVTAVTLTAAPVQQKPFHRCTGTRHHHRRPLKNTNPHFGSVSATLQTLMHQILMNNNVNTHDVPHEKYLALFYL